jgi:hypothetical protein
MTAEAARALGENLEETRPAGAKLPALMHMCCTLVSAVVISRLGKPECKHWMLLPGRTQTLSGNIPGPRDRAGT